ncbi:MAG: radical SAM protein [Candidatus Omnitrophica bacterium]|nr:radical SAM protein [Candidatus Omnitrophota bacterium]
MTPGTLLKEKQHTTQTVSPSFCCFGIVDECMFRCKMCFKWQEDRLVKKGEVVPFDAWKRAIISLKRIVPKPNEFVINFGGGEALLRDDILDLVRCASEEGFITNIASNGWLINDHMAQRIAQSGLRTINLSLDSLRENVHDEMRGQKGAAKQVFSAIDCLRRYSRRLEIGICTVLYDSNMNDILPLIKWVQKNEKVNWIVFMAAMQPNNTPVEEKWYEEKFSSLWPQRKRKITRLINYIKWLKWWGWKIQNPYHQLDAFKRYFSHPEQFVKNRPCNMDRAVHISATGDIFLCFRWQRIGNITTDAIKDVWHSQAAEKVRGDIRQCQDNCHFLLNCFFEKETFPFLPMNTN